MKVFQVDNARYGERAKVDIRRRVMAEVAPAHVFDAFAGSGRMFNAVWKDAASYVGCDEAWHADERCCYVGDNKRVMRGIDLNQYNLFDFDSYGSPWDQINILAARRPLQPDETLGLVLTDGTWFKTRTREPVRGLREALVLDAKARAVPESVHDELIYRALRGFAAQIGGSMTRLWRAVGTSGFKVRYIGAVVEHTGNGAAGPAR